MGNQAGNPTGIAVGNPVGDPVGNPSGNPSGNPVGNPTGGTSGIAVIAPDGHVVTATPHANTAGWPRLMTRLATSGDVLAIGEPIPARTGQPGFVPMARQIIEADGSFGGIIMYSMSSDDLARLSPATARVRRLHDAGHRRRCHSGADARGTRHDRHPHDADATVGRDAREDATAAAATSARSTAWTGFSPTVT